MFVRYINLDFWFYQIYLLLQAISRLAVSGPESISVVFIKYISFLFSILFLWLLVHSWRKTNQIRKREEAEFLAKFITATDPKTEKQEEWLDILDHADSDNESQWKLALIDADKILENLLTEAGFEGEGVGERLKNAEQKGGLRTLQDAWSAHKVRNQIAHESGFTLTKRDTRIAIESYKKVFEELGFF